MKDSKFILDSWTIRALIPLIILVLWQLGVDISTEEIEWVFDLVLKARDSITILVLAVIALYRRYIAKQTLTINKKVDSLSNI